MVFGATDTRIKFHPIDTLTFSASRLLPDPNNRDTDGDGLSDGICVNKYGTFSFADSNQNGISDKDEITPSVSINQGLDVLRMPFNLLGLVGANYSLKLQAISWTGCAFDESYRYECHGNLGGFQRHESAAEVLPRSAVPVIGEQSRLGTPKLLLPAARCRHFMNEQIVILDFGSQYTQVIARRVRECNVYSTILRYDTPAAEIAALKPSGIILSGGPSSVYAKNAPLPDKAIFKLGVPVLGICYGVQIVRALPRRQSRERAKTRIRQRHAHGPRSELRAVQSIAGDIPGLEFARRQTHEDAERLQARRRHGEFRIRGD